MVSHSLCASVGMFTYQTYLFLAMCYLQVRQPLLPVLLLLHSSLCFPHKSLGSPRRAVKKKAFLHQPWPSVVERRGDTREPRRPSVILSAASHGPSDRSTAVTQSLLHGVCLCRWTAGSWGGRVKIKILGQPEEGEKKRTGNFFRSPVKHQGSSRSVITHSPPWHFPALSHTE